MLNDWCVALEPKEVDRVRVNHHISKSLCAVLVVQVEKYEVTQQQQHEVVFNQNFPVYLFTTEPRPFQTSERNSQIQKSVVK